MDRFFPRFGFIWTVAAIVLIISFSPAEPRGKIRKRLPPYEYGTVVMNQFSEANQIAPVVFRHWTHRSKYSCRLCHVDIGFAMEAGTTLVHDEDNRRGMYCGVCHNGKEAFGWAEKGSKHEKQNCSRCHAPFPVGMDTTVRDTFFQLASTLPKGRFGNGIEWTKAEEEGLVKPRDFIPGVSFPRSKMKHEGGDINLNAKLAGLQDIIFSHKKHAAWSGCEMCHPDLFALKTGKTIFKMTDIFEGKFCGACHGKVAFPLQDCGLCHSKPV